MMTVQGFGRDLKLPAQFHRYRRHFGIKALEGMTSISQIFTSIKEGDVFSAPGSYTMTEPTCKPEDD